MTHRFTRRLAAGAGLALIIAPLLAASPASAHAAGAQSFSAPSAAADTDLRQLTVYYHDLDLTTPRGRAQLEQRINQAAATVCEYDRGSRPPVEAAAGHKCYVDALDHAHATLASRLAGQTLVSRQSDGAASASVKNGAIPTG
jgi:UrcA family protein